MDKTELNRAIELDQNDQLKGFRSKFKIPSNLIYLDGNSLGMMPNDMNNYIKNVTDHEWGDRLIRSWNEGWYIRPKEVASKIAKIIGAQDDEVIVCDSTSINLYKLAYSALKYQKGRKTIISDELNFPSDIYIFQGLIESTFKNHELKLVKSNDNITITEQNISDVLDEETALVSFSHVAFKSSYMYDMKRITELVHNKGALVLWDLSHSAGAIPLNLNDSNVDLAIGCTYKYLNGGPGSPAFLYVRKDLQKEMQSPIWGWFGAKNPFDFDLDFIENNDIKKFMTGTPSILSLSAVNQSIKILLEAGIGNVREKSIDQTEYLISLINKNLLNIGFSLGSPVDSNKRGSHISIQHDEAYRICKALIDPEVGNYTIIPDFREPNNIRIGIAPLYNTFEEIFELVNQLQLIVNNEMFNNYSKNKESVT